ncbi:MAG: rhomboid family intramembrane serine protease, partial [Methylococcaceae bacterium]
MIPIRDTAPCFSRPYVTWGIMAVCIWIFIAMKLMPDQSAIILLNRYGMVPIRYSSLHAGLPFDGYLSFLTNLFLHASWTHLIVNMWFLWIFSDNVEDRMGRLPFLIFYLVCGVFATILQWYFDPMLDIPVIGASGAIAGVLAAYFFLYPFERVIVFFPPIVLQVPAIT